jgi:hypothetical protein
MRTIVELDDDVATAVERASRERSIGFSEAVNELIRGGLAGSAAGATFEQRFHALGLRLDVSNISRSPLTMPGHTWPTGWPPSCRGSLPRPNCCQPESYSTLIVL